MKQLIITQDGLPGADGNKLLRVNADGLKPSEALKLIAEALAVLAGHVAAEYEAKRVEVATEVPA